MQLRNITFGLLDQWIECEVLPMVEKQIQKQDQINFQQVTIDSMINVLNSKGILASERFVNCIDKAGNQSKRLNELEDKLGGRLGLIKHKNIDSDLSQLW